MTDEKFAPGNATGQQGQEEDLEWYYRPWAIILAIFLFGPLGLIPLWMRPRTGIVVKLFVSLLVAILTVWMTVQSVRFYQQMMAHYRRLSRAMGPV